MLEVYFIYLGLLRFFLNVDNFSLKCSKTSPDKVVTGV